MVMINQNSRIIVGANSAVQKTERSNRIPWNDYLTHHTAIFRFHSGKGQGLQVSLAYYQTNSFRSMGKGKWWLIRYDIIPLHHWPHLIDETQFVRLSMLIYYRRVLARASLLQYRAIWSSRRIVFQWGSFGKFMV